MKDMTERTHAGIVSCVAVVSLATIAPLAAYGQVKPTVTVINPVSNPVNTRITNSVVPVEISNADPIPVQTAQSATPLAKYASFQESFGGSATTGNNEMFTASEPIQITGAVMQLHAGGATGSCTITLAIHNSNDAFIAPLALLGVSAGRSLSSPAIPFSNLTVPAGHKVKYSWSNNTSAVCEGNVSVYLLKS